MRQNNAPSGKLALTFLDVGHADSIGVRTPLGQFLLIDCGYAARGTTSPSAYFDGFIDLLVITHFHRDHFNDVRNIAPERIGCLISPPLELASRYQYAFTAEDKEDLARISLLQQKPVVPLLQDDAFTVEFIVPAPRSVNPHEHGIVTLLVNRGNKVLLGADTIASGWATLLEDDDYARKLPDLDLMKITHHGRNDGFHLPFMELARPRLLVNSDAHNPADAHKNCIEKYASYGPIRQTCDGTVHIVL
jgi:competence protein ComEC